MKGKHGRRDKTITEIAREELELETLEARESDRLDFHNLAVWQIKRALVDAYEAGRRVGAEREG